MKGSGKVTYTYHGNPFLRAAGVQVQLDQQQLLELAKCESDPIYFIENYVKIRNVNSADYVPFKMYNFQKKMIKIFHQNRFSICMAARQVGKCLESTTYVTLLNKHTKQQVRIQVGEFFKMNKINSKRSPFCLQRSINKSEEYYDNIRTKLSSLWNFFRTKEKVL